MKRVGVGLLLAGAICQGVWAADSVVVFNEVHYHPPTNELAHEWIELHNQMAIDIDLSAWSITGDIGFTFPEGTIIAGGGYRVVAINPAVLANAGVTNALGPFTGRLNNSAGVLRLRDRNDRLMDEMEYRDGGKWPVAPDGSGATLAKRDPNLTSDDPAHWTSSVRAGGTPGLRNFPGTPTALRQSLVSLDGLWRFEASGIDLGTAWREPGFNDTAWSGRNNATLLSYWPFDGNANALRGTSGTLVGTVAATADRNGAANGALAFNGALSQYVNVTGGGGLNGATAGTISMWVKWTGAQDAGFGNSFGAVLGRQQNGLFSDNIINLNNSSPASGMIQWRQNIAGTINVSGTSVVGENVWRHIAITFTDAACQLYVDGVLQGSGSGGGPLHNNPATPLTIGAWGGDGGSFFTGSIDDVAIWDRPLSAEQIALLAAQTKMPLDFSAPESGMYFSGDGRLEAYDEFRRTVLPLGPNTYYFRNTFLFTADPAQTELKLNLAVDDGAIVYLNGAEVHRHNMPAGAVSYSTFASSAVGDAPLLTGITLPTTNLVQGSNTVALEVHQAGAADLGMVFGASVMASIPSVPPVPSGTDPGALRFNEISAASTNSFQIELVNSSQGPVNVDGYIVQRTGQSSDAEFVLSGPTLGPGGFVVVGQTTLGFGAVPGDKLFLLRPNTRAVADAIEVHERPRARSQAGEWLTPVAFTAGASNTFALRDEIVINEIMYHGPPTLEVPAVLGTNTLITFSNTWRYEQSGTDLGAAWRGNGYDDGAWLVGTGLFYNTAANLPGPKNTLLALGPVTHYFRTTFVYTGAPAILSMSLRHIVDDGVVLYLNGAEVSRFNMGTAEPAYTNRAPSTVGTATIRSGGAVSITNLVFGTNVLAVEVHQSANTNILDVVFAAELTAVVEAVPRIPYSESTEQWIELFNRSSNAVNLTGWRLDEGVDYRFASNSVLAPGAYLVIAKSPAELLTRFPGLSVVGPYTNSLSRRGERIVLRDANDNPADAVHYFDDGRWPGAPDGGGASLELRNPWADNAAGEAWAASDESNRSSWTTYSYRGLAASSPVGPDGQWREFVLGLLDAGEVLLDDITVIETPATTPTNLLQNSTFDTGTNKWRIIGNHHGEVIDDPDQPGNKVLRLVANGPTEHMNNHAETTFVGTRDVVFGREYQISFRAKWINGTRQLHTRLYFNRLPRTTRLDVPALRGTPGTQNSTFAANLGPTYAEFRHDPPVPAPFEPVVVSMAASDPNGLTSMTLHWRTDGGNWNSVVMNQTIGSQNFAASIPGRPPGGIVQFYVEGVDALGAKSSYPASGTNSRALVKWEDFLAAANGLHNVRLITLTADADQLFRTVNLMSNERIGCTMIYDEREIFYDVGLRLKGSEHSRTTSARLGFNVSFPSEQRFRGVHNTVALDRSESTGFGQREMLIHQMLNHAGGVPTKYHDLVQIMAPRPEFTGSAELQLARYSDVFLDDQFPSGSEGTVYEYELVYQLLPPTDNGTAEGNKVPVPDAVSGTAIRNLGDDKEFYRWTFLIKNNEERDDFSQIISFAKAMELAAPNFIPQITNIIDVDQWLRGVAVNVLAGCGDSYGGNGAQHNVQFYVHPQTGRVLYFPHDMDAFFSTTYPIVPNADIQKLIAEPAFARAYYCHLLEIIETTYNVSYMQHWADNFGRLLPAQNFAGHLSFIGQRAAFVSGQVNAAVPPVAFSISNNGGNNFGTTNSAVTLVGTAPLNVKEIVINGVSYPITWTSTTAWSLQIPLFNGVNQLVVQGRDRNGAALTNALDTIAITNTGPGALLPIVINEWMADNAAPDGFQDPADGLFQDWFELFNPNTNAVNLAGFFLTDNLSQPARWQIPAGAIIGARGFLLVWADNQPAQNGNTNGHLHAAFQLNNGGEAIALFSPGGVLQHAVVFDAQFQNVSQGLFVDGDTNSFYFMTNWTPRAANTLAGPLRITGAFVGGGLVELTWEAIPGRTYRVEYKDDLTAPLWVPLGPNVISTNTAMSAIDSAPANPHRFYRIFRVD